METASLAGKLALIVDDTALNLRILDKQLKRWGMQTVLFERAQPALDWRLTTVQMSSSLTRTCRTWTARSLRKLSEPVCLQRMWCC